MKGLGRLYKGVLKKKPVVTKLIQIYLWWTKFCYLYAVKVDASGSVQKSGMK